MRPEITPNSEPAPKGTPNQDFAPVPTADGAAQGMGLTVDPALARKSPPAIAFVHVPGNPPAQSVGVVKRGESGYFTMEPKHTQHITTEKEALAYVDLLNEQICVSPSQAQSMQIGSMFGWDVPGAAVEAALDFVEKPKPVPPPPQVRPNPESRQPKHLQEWDRLHPELAVKLPVGAFVALPELRDGAYGAVTRGEKGYHKLLSPGSGAFIMEHGIEAYVDLINNQRGVTPLQAHCLKIGAMFGWDVPGADPDTYSAEEIAALSKRG